MTMYFVYVHCAHGLPLVICTMVLLLFKFIKEWEVKPIDLYTEFHSNTIIEHTVYTLKQNTLIEQSILFE